MIEKSFDMFRIPLGTWIPFALIFLRYGITMKIDLIEKTKELEDVESSLSTHERFDNYFSIFNRVVSFYQLALESLAKRLPIARTFLDALCQPISLIETVQICPIQSR